MLNFDFSGEVLVLVSPPYFADDFSGRVSLALHFINRSSFIV